MSKYPRFQVRSPNRDIIQYLYEFFDSRGTIRNEETSFVWYASRATDVELIISKILPYLSDQKVGKAKELLEVCGDILRGRFSGAGRPAAIE